MNTLKLDNTGGFPLDTDILDFMQNAYLMFNHLGNLAGNYAIISGCKVTGNKVENGVVFIDGEVLNFKGGTLAKSVIIKEEIKQLTFEDGTKKDVEKIRYATFGVGSSAVAWSKFKRPLNLIEFENDFDKTNEENEDKFQQVGTWVSTIEDKIKNLEIHLTEKLNKIVPKGLVAIWGRPANEIPEGWQECTDLSGRVPVGFDADYDYTDNDDVNNYRLDVKGAVGGSREHRLTINEMPKHGHPFKVTTSSKWGEGRSGGTYYPAMEDYGYYAYLKSEIYSKTAGGDKPHNNMPPYRVVEFIEFVGFDLEGEEFPYVQIIVKTLTGKQVYIDCLETDTIQAIKEKIQDKEGIPPDQQRLIFKGTQLSDNETLESYGIEFNSIINLVLR